MKQFNLFHDERLKGNCVYCGNYAETKDHVPSKTLLNFPYPSNLPVVPSCLRCNQCFSNDEEFLSCYLECAITGTANLDKIQDNNVKRALKRNKKMHAEILNTTFSDDGKIKFRFDDERIKNVILKLAKGHMYYEGAETQFDDPKSIFITLLSQMMKVRQNHFQPYRPPQFYLN